MSSARVHFFKLVAFRKKEVRATEDWGEYAESRVSARPKPHHTGTTLGSGRMFPGGLGGTLSVANQK